MTGNRCAWSQSTTERFGGGITANDPYEIAIPETNFILFYVLWILVTHDVSIFLDIYRIMMLFL